MNNNSTIIFDIDGTLSDCSHRRHFIEGNKKDWNSFYENMINDRPNPQVVCLYYAFHRLRDLYNLVIVTGRPEEYRCSSEQWLKNNEIYHDGLYMRQTGDYRTDDIIKKEILNHLKDEGHFIFMAIEDRNRVVKMWRDNDIVCLQCAEGNF